MHGERYTLLPWQYWIPNAIPYLIVFGCIIGAFIAVVIRRRKRGAVPNPHEQIAIKKSDGSG